ncbi:MAG: 30S ribosomal protein S15 [Candidatus Aminicenantes bacterium]|nr:30S ribosomal protein S15 [Candidatus Aminicenantes bacterium]
MLDKASKAKIIEAYRQNPKDSGSPEVQIALLTERINLLSQHLAVHRHDFSSRVGLMRLVGQRKRLLAYLKREDPQRYQNLLQRLNLRK